MKLKSQELSPPEYRCPINVSTRPKIGLAVESMKRHMTNEGWEIFEGLERAGYYLFGYALPNPQTDVEEIVKTNPSTLVLQDKREWDVRVGDFREKRARFRNVDILRSRNDIFKLTILKDAHQRPGYHIESANEIGCHAWIIYYHPDRVLSVAPYIRREHLIRTYHTIDSRLVPEYTSDRTHGCLLSGAVSSAYPLRERLFRNHHILDNTTILPHPGYHRNGTATPNFLRLLSHYKVAICTASVYKYALRKIMEATAAGCVVITDLGEEDTLPEIDGNLYRIPSGSTVAFVNDTIQRLIAEYDPERQKYYSDCCKLYYDFHAEGKRLVQKIEDMRNVYQSNIGNSR